MKIAVSSFYYPNYAEFAQKTVHGNLKAYCERHGYLFVPYAIDSKFEGNGYEWLCEAGKMNAVKVLQTLYDHRDLDYVFTVGCDAIITNMDRKLEGLALYYQDFDIVTGSDKAGVSTSQMFVKNSKKARDYYFEILKFIGNGGEHDQRYFWDNPRKNIARAPQRWLNAYDGDARLETYDQFAHWHEGDFLVHLAGLTLEQRLAVLDKWLGRVA